MFERLRQKLIPKDENAPAFRMEMARRVDGKRIRYVTERTDGEDAVIGREGSLTLRGDELILMADGNVLFRCAPRRTKISELLSLDGVILEGNDLEHDNAYRCVIAYYLYYRK